MITASKNIISRICRKKRNKTQRLNFSRETAAFKRYFIVRLTCSCTRINCTNVFLRPNKKVLNAIIIKKNMWIKKEKHLLACYSLFGVRFSCVVECRQVFKYFNEEKVHARASSGWLLRPESDTTMAMATKFHITPQSDCFFFAAGSLSFAFCLVSWLSSSTLRSKWENECVRVCMCGNS